MARPNGLSLRWRAALALVAALLTLAGAACGSRNSGFPKDAGEYTIQPNSLAFDGKKYAMLWADTGGGLHKAEGEDVRMQRDERTFLEIAGGSPIVHLKEDEAVIVRGRDRDGAFDTPWFPFFAGYALGNLGGGTYNQPYPGDPVSRGPGYQYPPTDSFGRGDQLNGSVARSKAETPDYSKVPPAPYAVSGQSGGTGGGNAASNKATGPTGGLAGGTGGGSAATNKATGPTGGQTGGTGTGSAASNKGTFSSGGSSGGPSVGGGSGFSSGTSGSSGSRSGSSSPPVRNAPSGRCPPNENVTGRPGWGGGCLK